MLGGGQTMFRLKFELFSAARGDVTLCTHNRERATQAMRLSTQNGQTW